MWKSCNFRITEEHKAVNWGVHSYKKVPCNRCSLKLIHNDCDMDDCILVRIFKFVAPVVDDTTV